MARTLASGRSSASNRVGVQNFRCSLGFNGNATIAKVQSAFGAVYGSPYSIEFWFNAPTQTTFNCLYSNGNSGAGSQFMRIYYSNTTVGKLQVDVHNDAAVANLNGKTSTGTYFDNRWHHLVWTDNSGTASLYVDGVLDGTNFNYTQTGTFTSNQTALGSFHRTTDSNFYIGKIVGFKTYSSALTASQVVSLYNGSSITAQPTLSWPLTEGAGTTAYDTSGNGNNSTITSGTYTLDVPSKARALVGGNLVYNGDFEFAPPNNGGVATTTTGKWVDGTSGGTSNTNINAIFGWQTNFTGTCAALFDSANAHSGNYALKVSTTATGSKARVLCGSAGGPFVGLPSAIPIALSTSYTYSFWMKTTANSGSATTGALLQATQRNNAGTSSNTFNLNPVVTTTTGWTQYTGTFTTGNTNGSNWILLDANVTGNDGTATLIMDAFFDEITLTSTTNTTRSLA